MLKQLLANAKGMMDSRRKQPKSPSEMLGVLMGAVYYEENDRLQEAEEIYGDRFEDNPNYATWSKEDKDDLKQELAIYFGDLDMEMYGEEFKQSARDILSSAWGVSDKESALKILTWLRDQGHQGYYKFLLSFAEKSGSVTAQNIKPFLAETSKLFPNASLALDLLEEADADPQQLEDAAEFINMQIEFAEDIQDAFPKIGLLGWDGARTVQVARLAFMAEYLSDEECWTEIVKTTEKLKPHVKDWLDFANSFLSGRTFWSGDEDEALEQAAQRLLSHPLSPWLYNPWH